MNTRGEIEQDVVKTKYLVCWQSNKGLDITIPATSFFYNDGVVGITCIAPAYFAYNMNS